MMGWDGVAACNPAPLTREAAFGGEAVAYLKFLQLSIYFEIINMKKNYDTVYNTRSRVYI